MHELPKELSNSLRSFRGSIYGNRNSGQHDIVDLEKGQEVDAEKTFDHALSPPDSSLILVLRLVHLDDLAQEANIFAS